MHATRRSTRTGEEIHEKTMACGRDGRQRRGPAASGVRGSRQRHSGAGAPRDPRDHHPSLPLSIPVLPQVASPPLRTARHWSDWSADRRSPDRSSPDRRHACQTWWRRPGQRHHPRAARPALAGSHFEPTSAKQPARRTSSFALGLHWRVARLTASQREAGRLGRQDLRHRQFEESHRRKAIWRCVFSASLRTPCEVASKVHRRAEWRRAG
jgi:hypothetical protein